MGLYFTISVKKFDKIKNYYFSATEVPTSSFIPRRAVTCNNQLESSL